MSKEIEGMIQSQEDWYKKSERGTSGDMVSDILHDWKLEREFLLLELDKMEAKVKELEDKLAQVFERASLDGDNKDWRKAWMEQEARLQQAEEKVKELEKEVYHLTNILTEQSDGYFIQYRKRAEQAEARLARIIEAVERHRSLTSHLREDAKKEDMEWIYFSDAAEALYREVETIKGEINVISHTNEPK